MTEKDRLQIAWMRAEIEGRMWGGRLNPKFYERRSYWMKDDQNLPLYHGLRTKNPDIILEKGFCTVVTRYEAREEMIKALRYYGKEHLMRVAGGKGELIRRILNEMRRETRRAIYVTTGGKLVACSWAERSYEFIFLTLSFAGIDDEDIFNYLSETYGAPYVITLKETYPVPDLNINLNQPCLPPEQIESIEPCHEIGQNQS